MDKRFATNFVRKGVSARYIISFWIFLSLVILQSCGGGGGGVGGGLIPGMMSMNTTAVLSGGQVQLNISGGLAPYAFTIYKGVGVTPYADPYGGVTIDSSGTLTVPDIGDDIDYVIVKIVDDMNRTKYFRVPVLGQPATWLAADKMLASDRLNGYVVAMSDQSGNGNDAASESGCATGQCPQYIGSDPLLNDKPTLYFDGVDDYIQFANQLSTDMTMALVFRSASGSGSDTDYTGASSIAGSTAFGASLSANGYVVGGTDATPLISHASSSAFNNNQGHVVLISRTSGGVTRVYVNAVGLSSDATTSSGSLAGGNTVLGAASDASSFYFLGAIPEVITFNRELISDDDDRSTLIRYLKEKYEVALPDVDPPTIALTSREPYDTDGTYSQNPLASFAYTYTSSPWADIETVKCQLQATGAATASWVDCMNPDILQDNYTKSYSGLTDNEYTFTVTATDKDDKSASATNTWILDRTAPVCTIDNTPPTDSNNQGEDLTDGWGDSDNYIINFSCADLSPLAASNPECSTDGGTSWAACTSATTHNIGSGLANNSTQSIRVRATDSLGNGPGVEDSMTWQVDLYAPTCTAITSSTGVTDGVVQEDTSESFSFSCSDTGAAIPADNHVRCLLERYDTAWSSVYDGDCTTDTSYDVSSLSSGQYRLTIMVTDQSGKVSTPQTMGWYVDLARPVCTFSSTPGSYGAVSPQSFGFDCTDDTGVGLAVACSYDGTFTDGVTCDSATAHDVTCATEGNTYHLYVRASDSIGSGTAIHHEWITDFTDPICSITSAPTSNPPTEFAAATIEFDCSDSAGAMPMASASCQLDGGAAVACDVFTGGTGVRSGSESVSVAGGDHELIIVGTDAAGRTSTPVTASWRTDLTIPICTIDDSNINGSYGNSATVVFPVSCTDDIALNDPSDLKPQCVLDDVTSGTTNIFTGDCNVAAATYGSSPYSVSDQDYTTPALTEGNTYRLTVNITDSSGKTMSSPPTVTWTVDLTAPTCSLSSLPSDPSSTDAGTITFSCDDSAGVVNSGIPRAQCSMDDGTTWTDCTTLSSHSFSGRADGTDTFRMIGYDGANNPAPVQTHTWLSDTTYPSFSTAVDVSRNSATQRDITFVETDGAVGSGIVSIECSIDNGATYTSNCTSPYTFTVTAGSTYNVLVRLVDDVGHITTSTVITEEILGDAHTVAECQALSDYSSHTFGGGGGDANLCIVENVSGVTCPGTWTDSGYTTTIATSNIDVGGVDGAETSEAWATSQCNSGAEPVSCTTSSHGWGTDAIETCVYDEGRPASWDWSSYGNPDGVKTLLNGNIVDTGLTCPTGIVRSEATDSLADNDCTGNQYDPTAIPIYESSYRPTACSAVGTNEACCLQECTPVCTGSVETVTAIVTQRGCQ